MTVETRELRTTDGYVVESPHGDVGRVEEIWLGGAGPQALAVRLEDGRRALLLEQDVLTVDRQHRWVVVPDDARLLELDAPRVASHGGRVSASWATTGEVVPASRPVPPKKPGTSLRRAAPRAAAERPLWELILILYAGLLVIVAVVTALVFAVPLLF